MLKRQTLINETAAYRKDARRHFDKAVAALVALAWPYRKEGFTFGPDFALYDDALDICINLSDQCAESARKRLLRAIEGLEWDGEWEEDYDIDTQKRMDMAGTHLLALASIWVSVAAVNGWTESYTLVMVSRYIHNPFLCPAWKNIPLDTLSWGRGYAKDIAEQLALIGQGIIISAALRIDQQLEQRNGASYYIRRRGSNFDCDTCDELANKPIPIDVPFYFPHPRCVCFPEYHYEPIPNE